MDPKVKAAVEQVVEAIVAIEQPVVIHAAEPPVEQVVEKLTVQVGAEVGIAEFTTDKPMEEKVAIELRAAHEMQARMMWGVKRGVNPKDVASLKALRGMNRKQRRAALVQAGKRVRKVQVAKKRVSGKDRT